MTRSHTHNSSLLTLTWTLKYTLLLSIQHWRFYCKGNWSNCSEFAPFLVTSLFGGEETWNNQINKKPWEVSSKGERNCGACLLLSLSIYWLHKVLNEFSQSCLTHFSKAETIPCFVNELPTSTLWVEGACLSQATTNPILLSQIFQSTKYSGMGSSLMTPGLGHTVIKHNWARTLIYVSGLVLGLFFFFIMLSNCADSCSSCYK